MFWQRCDSLFVLFFSWKGKGTLATTSSTSSSSTARPKRWPPSLPTASNLNLHVGGGCCKSARYCWRCIDNFVFVLLSLDIFALVTYLPGDDSYRFHIYSEESVPLFGPSLPSPPIFPKVSDFREFLLVKRT